MSALAEALLAAQRQAIAALSKAYVAGAFEDDGDAGLIANLDRIGATDAVDQAQLVQSLDVLRTYGAPAPKPTGQTHGPKIPDEATDAQKTLIAKLCREKNVPEPDVITSKQRAHEIIDALKAGTYNADAYTVPF